MVREVRLSSDFSGLDTVAWAFKYLGLPHRNVAACDINKASLQVLQHLEPEWLGSDVRQRQIDRMPPSDLHSFGAPCQSYSKSGKRARNECELGQLANYAIDYIEHHKPRMILMEQVPDIVSSEDYLLELLARLSRSGYSVNMQVLKSSDYGLPQERCRLYVIGIQRPVVEFLFPPPIPCPPLLSFLDVLPASEFKVLPEKGPRGGSTRLDNVSRHLQACVEEGVNPFERSVIITSGCSASRCNRMVDRCMTITRTEAQRQGLWCSTKGGFLDFDEMARLQGFWTGFLPWQDLGIADPQFGGLLGNAMSLNVVLNLIPPLLRSAGFVTENEFRKLAERARRYHPKTCRPD